ncbi:phosphotransferase [Patescibacteria group bacterium]|nr:phosphotransferase [Patescibacteria group bacterium]
MQQVYKHKNYLIFLDNNYIKKLLNRNIKKYFPGFVKCVKVESQHFRVLAATSFLVRYFVTLQTKHGHEWTVRIRGNRLNPTSYKIIQHLWNKHKYKNYCYPRPIYYFKKKRFILYENYDGMIYRNYHKKGQYFFNKTIPMIAKRLADLHQAKTSLAKTRTLKQEFDYLDEILAKIKKHNKKFYPAAFKTADVIKAYIKINYEPKKFTLIHNDFQASNIIYNRRESTLGFIDFEQFCRFFPAADLATFIIHLQTAIHSLYPKKTIRSFQRKFIREYGKYTTKKNLAKIEEDLPYFTARCFIDILAVSNVYLNLSRKHKRRKQFKGFIKYLEEEIKNLLPLLAKPKESD